MKTQSFDLVIHGATLVTAGETFQADLAIAEGKIAQVGRDLSGHENLDASGMLLLPGAIDPHVHLDAPVGATRSADDWESGTIAAACGGTTTVIDFVEPEPGEPLLLALEARCRAACQGAAIDFGLHMTLRDAAPATLAQVSAVMAQGATSFKTYLTYEGFALDDAALLLILQTVGAAGGVVLVHAENDAIVTSLTRQYVTQGQHEPRYHALSRPPAAEAEAVTRALALAEAAGAPVYIVHISTSEATYALASAQGRGVKAYGETCPQYLLLDDWEYSRPGFEGAKYVCSPPLRPAGEAAELWRALSSGAIQSIGTDHCPFNFVGQKDMGSNSFAQIPPGLPGIESRLALTYTFGVGSGRISLNRWVALTSTDPARIFGLYPRKGSLAPGADADLVVFDPEVEVELSAEKLHERVDYSPYEGFRLHGYPRLTLRRGRVIVKDGHFLGAAGAGEYLPRNPLHLVRG
jgi:dihydropyrimidinase